MAKAPTTASRDELAATEPPAKLAGEDRRKCGIIRPIASMGSYDPGHWLAVHKIVADALTPVGFDLRLVSEADSAGIILNEIVSNLFFDPIVVCDVSGRNPNVMFELGMRFAFEKPVVIIKDNETPFSFDISPVKHIEYPRTLRHPDMVEFQAKLAAAIAGTLEAAGQPGHRGYLQQFGPIEVTNIGTQQVGVTELASDIAEMRRAVSSLTSALASQSASTSSRSVSSGMRDIIIRGDISIIAPKRLHDDVSRLLTAAKVDWSVAYTGDEGRTRYVVVLPKGEFPRAGSLPDLTSALGMISSQNRVTLTPITSNGRIFLESAGLPIDGGL